MLIKICVSLDAPYLHLATYLLNVLHAFEFLRYFIDAPNKDGKYVSRTKGLYGEFSANQAM